MIKIVKKTKEIKTVRILQKMKIAFYKCSRTTQLDVLFHMSKQAKLPRNFKKWCRIGSYDVVANDSN